MARAVKNVCPSFRIEFRRHAFFCLLNVFEIANMCVGLWFMCLDLVFLLSLSLSLLNVWHFPGLQNSRTHVQTDVSDRVETHGKINHYFVAQIYHTSQYHGLESQCHESSGVSKIKIQNTGRYNLSLFLGCKSLEEIIFLWRSKMKLLEIRGWQHGWTRR